MSSVPIFMRAGAHPERHMGDINDTRAGTLSRLLRRIADEIDKIERESMSITAKVVCTQKNTVHQDDQLVQASLTFAPDYQDGRNQEWASATPSLSLSMTVKGAVAEHFEEGQRFTLAFHPEDQE